MIVSLSGFAQEFQQESIEKILLNADTCIREVEGDKIYLDESRLYPTSEGLFLQLNSEEWTPLSALKADTQGCYVRNVSKGFEILNRCAGCGLRYLVVCDNKDCPLKQEYDRKKEEKREEKSKRKND